MKNLLLISALLTAGFVTTSDNTASDDTSEDRGAVVFESDTLTCYEDGTCDTVPPSDDDSK